MTEFDTILDQYRSLSQMVDRESTEIQTIWQDARGRSVSRKYFDALAEYRALLSHEFCSSLQEISEADIIIKKIAEQYGIFGKYEEDLRKSLREVHSLRERAHDTSDRASYLAQEADHDAHRSNQFIQSANSIIL